MLYDQQEMFYGPNLDCYANERVAYLNPINICQERHTFRIGEHNRLLEGLEGEVRDKKIHDLKLEFESKYSFYIAMALLRFQDRESIMAPYNFG